MVKASAEIFQWGDMGSSSGPARQGRHDVVVVQGQIADHEFARGPGHEVRYQLAGMGRDEFRQAQTPEGRHEFGTCHAGLDGFLDGKRLVCLQGYAQARWPGSVGTPGRGSESIPGSTRSTMGVSL